MQLVKVDSSMVYCIAYDEKSQVLEVVFYATGVYRYHGVPKNVYDELSAASSVGSYMRDCIIDCYPVEKVKAGQKQVIV